MPDGNWIIGKWDLFEKAPPRDDQAHLPALPLGLETVKQIYKQSVALFQRSDATAKRCVYNDQSGRLVPFIRNEFEKITGGDLYGL